MRAGKTTSTPCSYASHALQYCTYCRLALQSLTPAISVAATLCTRREGAKAGRGAFAPGIPVAGYAVWLVRVVHKKKAAAAGLATGNGLALLAG
jgi:hypothetical protein